MELKGTITGRHYSNILNIVEVERGPVLYVEEIKYVKHERIACMPIAHDPKRTGLLPLEDQCTECVCVEDDDSIRDHKNWY